MQSNKYLSRLPEVRELNKSIAVRELMALQNLNKYGRPAYFLEVIERVHVKYQQDLASSTAKLAG
jgi:hypothetical protein